MSSIATKNLATSIGFTLLFFFVYSNRFYSAQSSQANQGYVPPAKDRKQQKATSSGSRGCFSEPIDIVPLIPVDHTPTTISANPEFLFLVETKPNNPVYFSLVEPGVIDPIWEKKFSINKSGVTSLAIPPDVNLDMGKEYVWNLKVLCNPHRPSQNWYIRATVKKVSSSIELQQKLTSANTKTEKAIILASNGIWYDAISTSYHDKNKEASSYFQQLLMQIGLSLPQLN